MAYDKTYQIRDGSEAKPFRFNDAEKYISEDNKYFQKVFQPQKLNIAEDMKWENLYYDEIDDYTRELWLFILFSAIIILGRMLL